MAMPIAVKCPYYKSDRDNRISCEGANVKLPDMRSKRMQIKNYCAGDWKTCTIARTMEDYYDRIDSQH